ncbi:hypothetical protein IVA80_04680 [Bradyrhizobium sp. 139]|uniref:hypothetical protein n=1 Tax=Bradyrhizobium sp. 139 TaxID=2782616 RepID=UPI001FFA12E3|nr:hypothetical protein [Bradyrhizobium sp. 139]MCK1740179.1 hypothetical protein [Bradyrhizobium sp. 139]
MSAQPRTFSAAGSKWRDGREGHSGIEIAARKRVGTYADGARREAPDATKVADRWHLPQNLREALRLAVSPVSPLEDVCWVAQTNIGQSL